MSRGTRRWSSWLSAAGWGLGLALSAASAAAAAPPPPPHHGAAEGREPPRERAKKVRQRLLRERVGLTEAQATAVEKVLEKYAALRHAEQAKRAQAMGALDELLAQDSSDEAAYRSALTALRAARAALQGLQRAEEAELAKLMSAKQQAKFEQAVRQLQRAVEGRRRGRRHHD